MSRLIRRGRAFLRKNGLGATCLRGLEWLVTRPKLLIYEPAESLAPVELDPTFDHVGQSPRIAVQLHVFYPKLLDELIDYTNRIPYRFDCYVSTDTEAKAETIRQRMAERSRAESVRAAVYTNRGRDIAPFLIQLAPVINSYDYVLHLHAKGSGHEDFGDKWRRYLLKSLLASPGYVAAMMRRFESDSKLGLVFQRTYWRVKSYLGWRGNRATAEQLFDRMGLALHNHRNPPFPAGSMFWARTAAILPLFECGLTMDDFQQESGQVEHTLAHCIERCWGCMAEALGYGWMRVRPSTISKQEENA